MLDSSSTVRRSAGRWIDSETRRRTHLPGWAHWEVKGGYAKKKSARRSSAVPQVEEAHRRSEANDRGEKTHKHGTRVVYFVPREITDALLPLHVTTTPDKVVRQLVGRIEYLTPEVEAEVIQALRDCGSPDALVRSPAMTRLMHFDRFLEPHVRRAMAQSQDPVVQVSGKQILESLQEESAALHKLLHKR